SAESSCPAELPGNQSTIDRSDCHALIGLGRCEIQRRQKQQIARYQIERHAHSGRQASACWNRSSQAAALLRRGGLGVLVGGGCVASKAHREIDEPISSFV